MVFALFHEMASNIKNYRYFYAKSNKELEFNITECSESSPTSITIIFPKDSLKDMSFFEIILEKSGF